MEFLQDAVAMEQQLQPHRRFQLTLSLGADTREGITDTLQALSEKLGNSGGVSVCGGSHVGWVCSLKEDPEMTHEKYSEALDRFLGRIGPADARPEDKADYSERQKSRLLELMDLTGPLTNGVVEGNLFKTLEAAKKVARIAAALERAAQLRIDRAADRLKIV